MAFTRLVRTPAEAVEAIRIDVARRRLEETTDRIEAIAEYSGFTGEEQMRTAFIQVAGYPASRVSETIRLRIMSFDRYERSASDLALLGFLTKE